MRLEHTCTVDGTYKEGGAYIKVGFWQMDGLMSEGLKIRGLESQILRPYSGYRYGSHKKNIYRLFKLFVYILDRH